MKISKVLHINDGHPRQLQNGNWLFVEEYVKASEVLNQYLAEGWEIQAMIPEYTPNGRDDGPAFFCAGFTVCLIRDAE